MVVHIPLGEHMERPDEGAQPYKYTLPRMAMASSSQNAKLDDKGPIYGVMTDPVMERFDAIMGEWHQQFMVAYKEYGPGAADVLGLAGEWAEMWRKVSKLKRTLWNGQDHLVRESAREVLMDLIGHAMLAIDMLDRGMTGGRE